MKEILFELAGLWIVAIGGWMMHETGKNMSRVIGAAALFMALVGFSATAVINQEPHREVPRTTVEPDSLMVKHVATSLPASSLEPLGSNVEPATAKYLASRNGRTYHSVDCTHYAPYIRGPIWYDSEESAQADGKKPCTECMKK